MSRVRGHFLVILPRGRSSSNSIKLKDVRASPRYTPARTGRNVIDKVFLKPRAVSSIDKTCNWDEGTDRFMVLERKEYSPSAKFLAQISLTQSTSLRRAFAIEPKPVLWLPTNLITNFLNYSAAGSLPCFVGVLRSCCNTGRSVESRDNKGVVNSRNLPKEMIKQMSMGREVDIAFLRRGPFTYWYTILSRTHFSRFVGRHASVPKVT